MTVSNNVHYDYKLNNLNQLVQKSYSSNDKEGTLYTYDGRGNLVKEEYGKLNGNGNNKRTTVAEYTYDETNKMVKGINSSGESSSYLFNGKDALVEQTWHIAKNGYGYHDVDAGLEEDAAANGKSGSGSNGKGNGNGNGQGNGNGKGDKPTGTTVGSFSTVVKQFTIDYTRETQDPLMEHEVNGLDYRYVYGNERLSVNVSPITNGSGHIVESGAVGQQIRLYYHQDLRGTVDYLTSPVSQKVESWTHYNEWGEITHNAVLKCGQRELDLVKHYATHDFDSVLNMYYAKARMYDAENRRFTSMDPILDGTKYDLSEYTTEAINFTAYVYVQDNPLRWIDPLGLFASRNDVGSPAYKLANLKWDQFENRKASVGSGQVYKLRDIFGALGVDLSNVYDPKTGASKFEYTQEGYVGKAQLTYNMSTANLPHDEGYRIPFLKLWYYDNGPKQDSRFSGALLGKDGTEMRVGLQYYHNNAYISKEALISYFESIFCAEEKQTTDIKIDTATKPIVNSNTISEYDAFLKALALVKQFEGAPAGEMGFDTLANSADGQGMSLGMIQFNFGSGSLQPLLEEINKTNPDLVKRIFGSNYDELVRVIDMTSSQEQVRWAETVPQTNGVFKSDWKEQFKQLARTEEFVALQYKAAYHKYSQRAASIAQQYGLVTERGYALAYNIAVHAWSTSATSEFLDKVNGLNSEEEKMVAIAEWVGKKKGADAGTRAMAIALGSGYVHGSLYNIDDFDLLLTRRVIYEHKI